MQLTSTLTCPECGHLATETMPTNACQFFYDCKGCGVLLRPNAGDCCVFCSFGDIPCPPIQEALHGSGSSSCCAASPKAVRSLDA
jgi:hypothetical protein